MKKGLTSLWNNFSREILVAFAFLLSLLLGTMLGSLWFHILPVISVGENPQEIVSPLTLMNYHPVNNVVRFFCYICSPLILWMGFHRTFLRKGGSRKISSVRGGKYLWYFSVLVVALLTIAWMLNFFIFNQVKLDTFWFFHEAEWLAPAWKYMATGEIWRGSFFAHGAIYDVLTAAWAWKFFSVTTIAAVRVFVSALDHSLFLGNALLCFAAVHCTFLKKEKNYYAAACAFLLLISVYHGTAPRWQHWERRDLPVLLGCFTFLFAEHRKSRLLFGIAGIFLALSWLYSIDRGAYFSLAIVSYIFLARILKKTKVEACKDLAAVLCGTAFVFAGFGLLYSFQELFEGLRTSSFHFQMKDLSDGNVYQAPAFPISNFKFLATNYTFPLVCICVQLLCFYHLWKRGECRRENAGAWTTQLFFLVLALAYYRGALSRCDELHWRYVSSPNFLGATLAMTYSFSRSHFFTNRVVLTAVWIVCCFFSLRQLQGDYSGVLANVGRAKNLTAFVKTPDDVFLHPWEKEIAQFLSDEFKTEKCFYSIVNEPLWPYLLKKPSCGRFHLTWLISDKRLQAEAIKELEYLKPGKILMNTPLSGAAMDHIPIDKRVKYLYAYITEHYEFSRGKNGWDVWARK